MKNEPGEDTTLTSEVTHRMALSPAHVQCLKPLSEISWACCSLEFSCLSKHKAWPLGRVCCHIPDSMSHPALFHSFCCAQCMRSPQGHCWAQLEEAELVVCPGLGCFSYLGSCLSRLCVIATMLHRVNPVRKKPLFLSKQRSARPNDPKMPVCLHFPSFKNSCQWSRIQYTWNLFLARKASPLKTQLSRSAVGLCVRKAQLIVFCGGRNLLPRPSWVCSCWWVSGRMSSSIQVILLCAVNKK